MYPMDGIRFDEHGGKFGKQRGMYMPGKFWVPEADFNLAWEIAKAHLPSIDWTKKVSSETFFTTEIWHQFWGINRFNFGRCIKYFSVHNMLPIEVANPGKKGKRFYKLKG